MYNEYYLMPVYDRCKSFYKKAKVLDFGNVKELKSYSTIVAKITYAIDCTIYEFLGNYSRTTDRHQRDFFLQNGLSCEQYNKIRKIGKLEILKRATAVLQGN